MWQREIFGAMELNGGGENVMAGAHVLVIPYGTHGHIAPMLTLAKKLARRGITITLVSYEDEIARLTSGDSSTELQTLGFRFIGLDNPGPGEPTQPSYVVPRLADAFQPELKKLVNDKRSGISGPTSILSDMFLFWTQGAAEELQIPRYMFIPSGVVLARLIQCFEDVYGHDDRLRVEADGKLAKFDGSVCIPGLPALHYHELPRSTREFTAAFLLRGQSLRQSAGVVVNSFYELEEKLVERWRRPSDSRLEHTKVPKIFPIGPLFSPLVTLPDVIDTNGQNDSALKSLVWLHSQPPASVLYVAFGSQFHLSPGQIKELAIGLEGSKYRFLWVIPQPKGSSEEETTRSITDILPPGFNARVGDRGCIVTGWVPQLQILAHSSTAAFLTHSGWNSSLESATMGVPMIAWPQSAEQHINCRYLVDDLKICHQIQTGAENILDHKEVQRAIRLVMEESEGKAMKSRVEELQRKGAAAVAEGGSQSREFQQFLDNLCHH